MTEYQPWDDEKRRYLLAGARNISKHETGHTADKLARENCGACALTKYTKTEAPNYAGWLRAYIQLGWRVPSQHYATEIEYAKRENQLYYEAIMRDIATWGIKLD